MRKLIEECIGFDWDIGNLDKNLIKHNVSHWECEQVFFNKPLLVDEDVKHSESENRMYALGITDAGRKLFMAFTIRKNLIRIISARDMSKRERGIYEAG
ncbi:MAG: BrnT family toxin [Gammaproteobacteria bacterium]